MRKKGSYHKNRPFRLLVAAALRFVQSYLNDIDAEWDSEKNTQDAQRGHQHTGLSFIDLHALHHVCQNRLKPVLTEAGRQI